MLAAQGTGWAPKARVTFTLALGPNTYGVELRTTASGTFEVGARKANFCYGSRYWARDLSGNQAYGPIGDPYCAPHATTSRLVVLQGERIKPKVTRVVGTGGGKTAIILVGDALYLWEKGTTSPALKPAASDRFFALIGAGRASSPACRQSSCPAGFFWKWIGMQPGRTAISLTPWCGTGPCPEQYVMALSIRIKPRPAAA
jgi:hypothetical protein